MKMATCGWKFPGPAAKKITVSSALMSYTETIFCKLNISPQCPGALWSFSVIFRENPLFSWDALVEKTVENVENSKLDVEKYPIIFGYVNPKIC
jgi:hypothetical protein